MILAEDLRKSVLQAAIQGKLVNQRPEDGTGEELYAKIRAKKVKLIKEGRAKKEKELTNDVIPFDIPDNWIWVKLGNLTSKIGAGSTPSGGAKSGVYKASGIPFIREMNVYDDGIHKAGMVFISKELSDSRENSKFFAGDLLLNITGGSIGRCAVVPPEMPIGDVNQHVEIIRLVDSSIIDFVHVFLCSPFAQSIINGRSVGDKAGFSATKCKNIEIPLPPLLEQIRIVNKLKAIMRELDAYASAEREIVALQSAFPDDMRKSILYHAMQGKLVEQYLGDGTGEDLYQQIRSEKSKLIKAGKIKKEKQFLKITADDIPFDIPDSWRWVRFGEIVDFRLGKTPSRTDSKSWGNDYRWVSISDMVSDGYVDQTNEGISEYGFNSVFRKNISPKGTLIMSFKLTIGCVSILNIDSLHNEAIISIFPFFDENHIMRDYLFKVLPQISRLGNLKKAIKGSTLNSDSLNNLLVPLPPLAEQKRIVEKLDKIIPLMNAIKEIK